MIRFLKFIEPNGRYVIKSNGSNGCYENPMVGEMISKNFSPSGSLGESGPGKEGQPSFLGIPHGSSLATPQRPARVSA